MFCLAKWKETNNISLSFFQFCRIFMLKTQRTFELLKKESFIIFHVTKSSIQTMTRILFMHTYFYVTAMCNSWKAFKVLYVHKGTYLSLYLCYLSAGKVFNILPIQDCAFSILCLFSAYSQFLKCELQGNENVWIQWKYFYGSNELLKPPQDLINVFKF